VAAELAPAGGAEPPVYLVLDLVGLVERGGRQLAPQPLEACPPRMGLEDVIRDPRYPRPVDHAFLLPQRTGHPGWPKIGRSASSLRSGGRG
jgi:hypothetical protein